MLLLVIHHKFEKRSISYKVLTNTSNKKNWKLWQLFMNSNYFYSNIVQTSKNKSFLEEMQSIAESIKQQVYVLSGPLIDGKYQYNDDSLIIYLYLTLWN